jgi:hypothetical protein
MLSAVARRDFVVVDVMLINDAKQILKLNQGPKILGIPPKVKA